MLVHAPHHDFTVPWPGYNVQLAVLRAQLAAHTHLDAFAIVAAGAVMQDDHATRRSPPLLSPLSHSHHLLQCLRTA